MAMLGSEHFEPTDIAGLAGVAEADVLGALHVRSYKRSDRARRGVNDSIANWFGLTQERGLIGRHKFTACRIIGQTDAPSLTASKR
jgi:hypothetical protein